MKLAKDLLQGWSSKSISFIFSRFFSLQHQTGIGLIKTPKFCQKLLSSLGSLSSYSSNGDQTRSPRILSIIQYQLDTYSNHSQQYRNLWLDQDSFWRSALEIARVSTYFWFYHTRCTCSTCSSIQSLLASQAHLHQD
jgi:hypothetical protein